MPVETIGANEKEDKGSALVWIIIAIVAVVVIGGGLAFFVIIKKKAK